MPESKRNGTLAIAIVAVLLKTIHLPDGLASTFSILTAFGDLVLLGLQSFVRGNHGDNQYGLTPEPGQVNSSLLGSIPEPVRSTM